MKFVGLILLISLVIEGRSQSNNGGTLDFRIFCGIAAQTSKEVDAFKWIVDSNDTTTISDKLINGSKLEQVLAAIILKYYQTNHSLQLTEIQRKMIIQVSNFKDKFSLCFTCTFQQDGTVKELFNRKRLSGSYAIIESYLSGKLWPPLTFVWRYGG